MNYLYYIWQSSYAVIFLVATLLLLFPEWGLLPDNVPFHNKHKILNGHEGSFIPFTLVDKEALSNDTSIYTFSVNDPNSKKNSQDILGISPGQYVTLTLPLNPEDPNSTNLTRPYAVFELEDNSTDFKLLIEDVHRGGLSTALNQVYKVNDTVFVDGPFGNYKYKRNLKKKVGVIVNACGASAPMPIVHEILDDPNDDTLIKIIYLSPDNSFLLTDYYNSLISNNKKGQLEVEFVNNIDESVLNSTLISWLGGTEKYQQQVLICGSPNFESHMVDSLVNLGFDKMTPAEEKNMLNRVYTF